MAPNCSAFTYPPSVKIVLRRSMLIQNLVIWGGNT